MARGSMSSSPPSSLLPTSASERTGWWWWAGIGPLCYGGCTSDDPYRLGIWCFNSESERNEILGAIVGGVIAGAVLAVAAAIVAPVTIATATAASVALPVYAGSGPIESSLILVGISAM